MKKPILIVITGPTASGKSALAVELAQRLGTEIISADSRQIYQGIPIVTAMPSEEERGGVCHHLMDVLPLDAYYSASEFERDSMDILGRIFSRMDVAVVCGGSMLYVDALCNGIDDLPTIPGGIRTELTERWKERGDIWLLEELNRLDHDFYKRVDRKNMKRVFHAVEICLAAGMPYSRLITGERRERPFDILKICMDGDRGSLFGRINSRVTDMLGRGLVEEAKRVYAMRHLNSLNTVGLKEMFAWIDGVFTLEEAVARIQKNTRVYAKKQLTWYRRATDITRLDFEESISHNTEIIMDMAASRAGLV